MAAFSNGITISKSKITDTNRNGIIDAEDLKFATGSATIDYQTSTKNIKPQSTNFSIGITYTIMAVEKEIAIKNKVDHKAAKLIVPVAINKGL
jgi:hypothetical protein